MYSLLLFITTVTMVFATNIEVKPNPVLELKEELLPEESKHSQDIHNVLEHKPNRNLNAGHHHNIAQDRYHYQAKTRSSHSSEEPVYSRTHGDPTHDSHPNIGTWTKLTVNQYIPHHGQPIRDNRYLRARDNRIILSKIIRPDEYKKFPNHDVYLEHLSKARLTERQHHKHEAEHHHHRDHNPYFGYNKRDHYHKPCGCDEDSETHYQDKQAFRHRGHGLEHQVLDYDKHLDGGYQVHEHTNTGHDTQDHERYGHNYEHHAHDHKGHDYAHHNHYHHGHHILNRWHETIFVYPMKYYGHHYDNHEHHHGHRHGNYDNEHHNEEHRQVQDYKHQNQDYRLHGHREHTSYNHDHGHYQNHDDHTQHSDHHDSNHGYEVQELEEHDHDHRPHNRNHGHDVLNHEHRHHSHGHRVRA